MGMKKNISPKEEFEFCLELWGKQGGCSFGKEKHCTFCATPYVLWKLMTGEIIHEELSLEEWRMRLKAFRKGI